MSCRALHAVAGQINRFVLGWMAPLRTNDLAEKAHAVAIYAAFALAFEYTWPELCDYPFVFDPLTYSELLHMYVRLLQVPASVSPSHAEACRKCPECSCIYFAGYSCKCAHKSVTLCQL